MKEIKSELQVSALCLHISLLPAEIEDLEKSLHHNREAPLPPPEDAADIPQDPPAQDPPAHDPPSQEPPAQDLTPLQLGRQYYDNNLASLLGPYPCGDDAAEEAGHHPKNIAPANLMGAPTTDEAGPSQEAGRSTPSPSPFSFRFTQVQSVPPSAPAPPCTNCEGKVHTYSECTSKPNPQRVTVRTNCHGFCHMSMDCATQDSDFEKPSYAGDYEDEDDDNSEDDSEDDSSLPDEAPAASTWGIKTLQDSSDEDDDQATMQQLSKMKSSMVAIYNRKYVVPGVQSDRMPDGMPLVLPDVLPDRMPDGMPHVLPDVLPSDLVPQVVSEVDLYVVPDVVPQAVLELVTDVVPGTKSEATRRDTFLTPVGLTEFIPPAGPPPDPGSQSESDEQTNNSNLCIVTYDDMAGRPDDHYAMPALLIMVNTITDTSVQPVLDSFVMTPMCRITTGFFSVYEELLAMDNHAWNAGHMPWHPQNGRQRGPDPEYQRSIVGSVQPRKRGRQDEPPPVDAKNFLISELMKLCEPKQPGGNSHDDEMIEAAVKLCKREIHHKGDSLHETLVDCAVEMSTKTPHYALLTGQRDRARLLLRFFAALADVKVLHPSSVISLMDSLVEAASCCAADASDKSGHTWQPWTDFLVYIVVAALPWAGAELAESSPTEMARLMESVDSYMLWAAVRELASSETPWKVASIPSVAASFEVRLASAATSHELPHIMIPQHPPLPPGTEGSMSPAIFAATLRKLPGTGTESSMSPAIFAATLRKLPGTGTESSMSPAIFAATLRKVYPPRGGIRLLDRKHTEQERPAIERFVAEEYILDTLAVFDGHRVDCARRLVYRLPLPWEHRNLLAEVLFSQMMTLPTPKLEHMAYGTIMVDLCKFTHFEFPKALSACVRELFSRMAGLEPELRSRLVEWLSYHLSNFEYQWPWERWAWVVAEPACNPQRQFCSELLARLIRLSYWERVHQLLPEKFQELLGPAPDIPMPQGLKPPAEPEAEEATGKPFVFFVCLQTSLSYWERVYQLLPEKFQELLGPAPDIPMPQGPKPPAEAEAEEATDAAAGDAAAQAGDADTEMQETDKPAEDVNKEAKEAEAAGAGGNEEEAGDTTGRQGAGDTTGRQKAGDTTGRQEAGDTTGRQEAGDTTGRQEVGDTTARQGAGDTTGRQEVGDTTARQEAGDTTGRQGAGDTTGGRAGDTTAMDAGDAPTEAPQAGVKKVEEAEVVDTVDRLADELADELLAVVRSKATTDEIITWLHTRGVDAKLGGGPSGKLKVVMHCLLAAGSKSPTHLSVALERYTDVMRCLQAAGSKSPTHLSVALERYADVMQDCIEASKADGQQVVMRCLLVAGSKSPTHLSVALERYADVMRDCIEASGSDGQQVLLSETARFYQQLPQKILMVVDRLMELKILQATAVSKQLPQKILMVVDRLMELKILQATAVSKDTRGNSSAWEVLRYSICRVYQRKPELMQSIQKVEEDVTTLKNKAKLASEKAALAASECPNPDPGNELQVRRALMKVEGATNEERIMTER
eukprot:gene25486-11144_t